jgi:hypothetical protein
MDIDNKMNFSVYLNRRCRIDFEYQSPDYRKNRPYYHYYANMYYRVPVKIFWKIVYVWKMVGSVVLSSDAISKTTIPNSKILNWLMTDRNYYKESRKTIRSLKYV